MTCGLFNRYRDGELGAAQREVFEAHLRICVACRSDVAVLDNLTRALPEPAGALPGGAEIIARLAFELGRGWDAYVVSWLRPAPAWVAVALLSVAFVLWLAPEPDAYAEYETISRESEVMTAGGFPPIHDDEDLVRWLEQAGKRQ
jgi:anti-sigma factor RsiW